MPENYQTRDTKLHISKLPESAFNTFPTANTDYVALISREPFWLLPGMEKIDDADAIGTGTEFLTTQENGYWDHIPVNLINNQALFDAYGRMALRAFGGEVVTAAETSGYKHTAILQKASEGRQLPSSSLIVQNGAAELLVAGAVISEWSLAQQRNNRPEMRVAFVGSGKHKNPHAITSLPAYVPPTILGGARGITVKYTNAAAAVVDLGASGCQFRDFNISLNNNLKLQDRCPGDPAQTMGDPTDTVGLSAANYVSRILRQSPRAVAMTFTFLANETNPEYARYAENEAITDVTIAILGETIGAGPARQTLAVVFPKARIRTFQTIDSEGDSAFTAVIVPAYDSGIDSGAYCYVINDTATNFE